MNRRLITRLVCAAICGLSLVGCSNSPVAEEMTQVQANEIVALLNSHGVSAMAQRESGQRGRYSVEVRRSDYSQAIALMTEHGLPSAPKLTIAELIEPKGILPNSREVENLRLDHALAIEIEDMIMAHGGIASAKVIVRYNFAKEDTERGVSVVAQVKAGASVETGKIAEVIGKVLPGIKPENVSVNLSQAQSDPQVTKAEPLVPFLLGWRVPEDDYNGIAVALIGCLLFTGILGGIVGYWSGQAAQTRPPGHNMELPEVTRSLKIDRSRRDMES